MYNAFNPYGYAQDSGQTPGQLQGQAMGPGMAQGGHPGQYQQGYAPGSSPSGHPTGPYQPAFYPAQAGYPAAQHQNQTPFLNFSNDRFLKGLLIGAAAAYVLTNESVQRGAIKGVVKIWSTLQGGVEEIKERFQDAEAEIRAAEAGHET